MKRYHPFRPGCAPAGTFSRFLFSSTRISSALLSTCTALLLSAAPAARGQEVVINEIHYEPLDETLLEEFVELYHAGGAAIDLSGWYFSDGITYAIPQGTILSPGEYLVVAESPSSLLARYPGIRAVGPFEGRLSNDGERLILRDSFGTKRDEVDYQLGFPWPTASAGRGGSMELIHPLLDNDLGGSWRAASASESVGRDPVIIVPAQDPLWRYRKGTSEASSPMGLWREVDFTEDASWAVGRTSIGYGDGDDNTTLGDMLGGYTSVYLRRAFTVTGEIPRFLRLKLYVDDGCIVWINGIEVARAHVSAGDKAYSAVGDNHDAVWEDLTLSDPEGYIVPGENIIAIHAFNTRIDSSDFSIDAELYVPGIDELPAEPTPGKINSVHAEGAPPQIRQVEHVPQQPAAWETILVTAKVTDPDGVSSVKLDYQVVLPGSYIPARLALEPAELMANPTKEPPPNPVFEDPSSWNEVVMTDDGRGGDATARDGVYTGEIPSQANRTLVRYRITAADTGSHSVTVPYPDDPSLNFACFVYDGVPPYRATTSVKGAGGYTYSSEVLTSLPVYFLITRAADVARCVAYSGSWQIPKGNELARDAFNWEGAFVYDGIVYDHITYRLRQANDRYHGGGKRSWRIRFHTGNYLRAHDNFGRAYPERWRTLNVGKMFDNLSVGNFGLTETLNAYLWNFVGVPAPFCHTFHFRVVDGLEEAPAGSLGQYYGDFWGMALAMEDYDPHFVDGHGLPDGNLYKLKDGIFDGNQLKRNQGRYSVTGDADFQNIRANLRPERDAAWLNAHVRYERWYPYHAVVEGIRHYDFVPADSHSKNRAWFFEPSEGTPYGLLWTLPWDSDASWGPNWNSGIDYSKQAIFGSGGKPEFKIEYRNVLREFRDLVWRQEIIGTMIDQLAAIIVDFVPADRDRWRGAPADAGSQDYGTMEWKVNDMKGFAFTGWSGSTGPTVPAGGRAGYLDSLAAAEGDSVAIPVKPTVTAIGPSHFPMDLLVFETTPFTDPQGDATFGALKWRLAEVTDDIIASFEPGGRGVGEWNPTWESELAEFDPVVQIPIGVAVPGRTYRIRSRMMDSTKRWSPWSNPVEFTVSEPDGLIPQREYLRITEIMYNPAAGGDLEFLELQNTGPSPLDLSGVEFAAGLDFSFEGSEVTSLAPGEYVVIVKSRALFETLYDTRSLRIAGEYGGKLDNGGDEIILKYGSITILQFTYQDYWYPSTDGGGRSLVIVDARAPIESWGLEESWQPSALEGGSPGADDVTDPLSALRRPGDLNGDASLDLADALGLLLHLFVGSPAKLPCGESVANAGNLALLDSSGDGSVNVSDCIHVLNYLFRSGPPPVLGQGCVRIHGCLGDACAP